MVARYAIGRLYRPPQEKLAEDSSGGVFDADSRGTIIGLEAMNFITIATPHLGSRGNKQVVFLLISSESTQLCLKNKWCIIVFLLWFGILLFAITVI